MTVSLAFLGLYGTWLGFTHPSFRDLPRGRNLLSESKVQVQEKLKAVRWLLWQARLLLVASLVGLVFFAARTVDILKSHSGDFDLIRFTIVVLEGLWGLAVYGAWRRQRRARQSRDELQGIAAGDATDRS